MRNSILENEISNLDLESKIVEVLYNNEKKTVGDLWELNRQNLKAFGLNDAEIKQIIIKLQLLGLDLNRKVYK